MMHLCLKRSAHNSAPLFLAVWALICTGEPPRSQPAVYWPAPATTKILRTTPPPSEPATCVTLSAARNERESFQVVISPLDDLTNVLVKATELRPVSAQTTGSARVQAIPSECCSVYQVGYVPMVAKTENGTLLPASFANGLTVLPDPLLPHIKPVSLRWAEGNHPFWVTVQAPKETTPGVYRGSVQVMVNRQPVYNLAVHLTVHPFTLPEVFTTRMLLGLPPEEIAIGQQVCEGSPAHKRLMDRYFLFLLQNGLTPSGLPVAIHSAEAKRYLDSPHLRRAYLPLESLNTNGNSQDNTLHEVSASPELCARTTVLAALPEQTEEKEALGYVLEQIKSRLRGIKVMMTCAPDPQLRNIVDIWTPTLGEYRAQQAIEYQKTGRQVWWRIDHTAQPPFPSLLIRDDAISHRILPWQQVLNNIDGLYLPSVVMNSTLNSDSGERSHLNVWTLRADASNLDASFLLYPATRFVVQANNGQFQGPFSSIRLELLREGLEDNEHLYSLARVINDKLNQAGIRDESFGRQRVREWCTTVMQGLTQFTRDHQKLERVRNRIAEEIQQVQTRTPLLLVKTTPPDYGATAYSGAGIVVEGVSSPGALVKVAGQPVRLDERGKFTVSINPASGVNRIIVESSQGQAVVRVTRTVTVVKDPELARAEELLAETAPDTPGATQRMAVLRDLIAKYQQGKYTESDHNLAQRLLNPTFIPPTPSVARAPYGKTETMQRTAPPPPARIRAASPVYLSLTRILAKHQERKETAIASIVQEALRRISPDVDPKQQPCILEPVLFLGQQGFRLSNGLVDAVVLRQGARIVQFQVGQIPLLAQACQRVFEETEGQPAGRNLGGYWDKVRNQESHALENWNFVVTRQSPSVITLEARHLFYGGQIKLRRSMTIKQGYSCLHIDYRISNQTPTTAFFPWCLNMSPGVGFSAESGRGNPWDDRLIILSSPAITRDAFDRKACTNKVTSERAKLTGSFIAFHDALTKAALVLIPPSSSKNVNMTFDGTAGMYMVELGDVSESDRGVKIAAGSTVSFSMKMEGLMGVSSGDGIWNRFGQKPRTGR